MQPAASAIGGPRRITTAEHSTSGFCSRYIKSSLTDDENDYVSQLQAALFGFFARDHSVSRSGISHDLLPIRPRRRFCELGFARFPDARNQLELVDRLFPCKTPVGAPNQRQRFVELFPALAQALVQTRHDGRVSRCTRLPRKGKAMACRNSISFAAVVMGLSSIVTDASATCEFKAKKDIIVILDVGHTDKDSGQISARGVKEYDLNMNLARLVSEELVNTGFISTQMIVMSGSNTHGSRLLRRSKRANDLDADLFISIHHDGVNNETRMPWRYNGKEH
jgi:N-acetylmuramoyl-L-alanine amidase